MLSKDRKIKQEDAKENLQHNIKKKNEEEKVVVEEKAALK